MASSRFEIKVNGKDVSGRKMLHMASGFLKLLRAVEREKDSKSHINWRVDMMSGSEYGLIAIWANSEGANIIQSELATVGEMLKERLKMP